MYSERNGVCLPITEEDKPTTSITTVLCICLSRRCCFMFNDVDHPLHFSDNRFIQWQTHVFGQHFPGVCFHLKMKCEHVAIVNRQYFLNVCLRRFQNAVVAYKKRH